MSLASAYARAIHDVRKEKKVEDSSLIASAIAAMKRRRHEKLLPQVLEEYKRLEKEQRDEYVVRAPSEREVNDGIDKLREFGVAEYPRIVIDEKLVKGYVVEGKDFRYDASAKRSLVDLYKRLTA
ncbi:MAG TPA: F0F1 ATP synthase subunit delta [Candidatus Paceibacterota bacterium]|nr:F0F1 ATP synthase subunit delta [Candidatus Paceibacterota bacterium]